MTTRRVPKIRAAVREGAVAEREGVRECRHRPDEVGHDDLPRARSQVAAVVEAPERVLEQEAGDEPERHVGALI